MPDAYDAHAFLTLCHCADKARIVKILSEEFQSDLSLESLFRIGGAEGAALHDVFIQLSAQQKLRLNQWACDINMLTYELRLPELTPTVLSLSEFERRQLHDAGNEYDRSLWLYEHKREVFHNSVNAHREAGEPMSMFFSSFHVSPPKAFVGDDKKYDIFCDLIALLLGCEIKAVVVHDITPYDLRGQKHTPPFYVLKVTYNTPANTLSQVVKREILYRNVASTSTLVMYYDAALGVLNVFSKNYAIRREVAALFSEVLLEDRGDDYSVNAIAYTYDHLLSFNAWDTAGMSITCAGLESLTVSWRGRQLDLRVRDCDAEEMQDMIAATLGPSFLQTQSYTLSNVQLSFVIPSAYGQERTEKLHFKNRYSCRINADSFGNLHLLHSIMRHWGILPTCQN